MGGLRRLLILLRLATDDGARTDLDDVLKRYGLDRAEIEAEIEAEEGVDSWEDGAPRLDGVIDGKRPNA